MSAAIGDQVEWVNVFQGRKPSFRIYCGTVINVISRNGVKIASIKETQKETISHEFLSRLSVQPQRTPEEQSVRRAQQDLARKHYRLVASANFGIIDPGYHVYSVHKTRGGLIGYIQPQDVPNFMAGDTSGFTPIDNWRYYFSLDLIERLGLPKPKQEAP